jgi:hypothetical protein
VFPAAQFTQDEIAKNPNRLPHPKDSYNNNRMKNRRPMPADGPGESVCWFVGRSISALL